ncbi:hypothetical protein GGH12_001193, partial [Coemansia sp. RSA 1822]
WLMVRRTTPCTTCTLTTTMDSLPRCLTVCSTRTASRRKRFTTGRGETPRPCKQRRRRILIQRCRRWKTAKRRN